MEIYNPNPTVYKSTRPTVRYPKESSLWLVDDLDDRQDKDEDEVEEIDQDEIFDLIRSITDPEHKHMTLEDLMVVTAPQIHISPAKNVVDIEFTPTVPHCGMSTLIGLSIRVRLLRSLPQRFKVDIRVKPGSHQSEHAINKQLNDKERVAAALENPALLTAVEDCLVSADHRD
ncbi:hypothetical protein JAAARDRAFT_192100 [Jaapia argillacea MUCL 33604]|uniref:MIP18 family-like domain-containing protein n=1 Tax=Jaapia argillacea MUCL 33604 TaxID=933084 RepID=A0A067PY17_9AGAM|nr:hypothetical protein JAAARDRAFT_192100 [Jaapia argillacea MUCL 33604]